MAANHLTWHSFEQYLNRLVVDLEMNLVRLPLSAEWINGNMAADNYICGEYRYMLTLSVLDDVLERLAARGIFVMLDMHTLHSDRNFPLWCDPEPCGQTRRFGRAARLRLEAPSRLRAAFLPMHCLHRAFTAPSPPSLH